MGPGSTPGCCRGPILPPPRCPTPWQWGWGHLWPCRGQVGPAGPSSGVPRHRLSHGLCSVSVCPQRLRARGGIFLPRAAGPKAERAPRCPGHGDGLLPRPRACPGAWGRAGACGVPWMHTEPRELGHPMGVGPDPKPSHPNPNCALVPLSGARSHPSRCLWDGSFGNAAPWQHQHLQTITLCRGSQDAPARTGTPRGDPAGHEPAAVCHPWPCVTVPRCHRPPVPAAPLRPWAGSGGTGQRSRRRALRVKWHLLTQQIRRRGRAGGAAGTAGSSLGRGLPHGTAPAAGGACRDPPLLSVSLSCSCCAGGHGLAIWPRHGGLVKIARAAAPRAGQRHPAPLPGKGVPRAGGGSAPGGPRTPPRCILDESTTRAGGW